jgi:hypothetical protein
VSRIVLLGNSNALDNGRPLPGKRITELKVPEGDSVQEFLRTCFHPDGLWPLHCQAPAPDWVEGDTELAKAVSLVTGCPVGRPDDWD